MIDLQLKKRIAKGRYTRMPDFHYQEAFDYYDHYINRQERFKLLREHKFSTAGSVPSVDWELFGSILTGNIGKTGYGSDLVGYEVKSAAGTGSYEYQYHLNGGLSKLKEDMTVDHIFISYTPDYATVTVRLIEGAVLAPMFQQWEPALIENYRGANRRQRFRRSIAYGTVATLGTIVMRIEMSCLVFPSPSLY